MNSRGGYLWPHGSSSARMSLAQFSAPLLEGLVSSAEQVKLQLQPVEAQSWFSQRRAADEGAECLCRVSWGVCVCVC